MAEAPSGMPAKWEDILAMFHDGTTKLPDRNQVAGPGSKRWITKEVNGAWFSGNPDHMAKQWGLDGYYAFAFPTREDEQWLMFGFGYNWTDFGNGPGALSEFTGASGPILGSVLAGTNKDANPLMSSKAAEILANMEAWTGGWAAEFNRWAENVGNGSEELEGESAELFEAALQAVKRALQETQSYYLGGVLKNNLNDVSTQLTTTIGKLQENFSTWFDTKTSVSFAGATKDVGSVAMAFTHLYGEFLEVMDKTKPTSDHDATVSGLDWNGIETAAKNQWLAHVKTGLDDASAETMTNLANSYNTASGKLSDANSIVKSTFTISLTPEEQEKFYDPANSGADGSTAGDDFLNKFKEMFGGGAGGDAGGGTDGDGSDLGVPPPVTGPSAFTSSSNLPKNDLSLGTTNPVTGPSGSTSGTTGPNVGSSLTVPAGSRIDPKTGAVTDAKGKPVLGADGKPLVVPPGSTIGSGGRIVPPATTGPKQPTLPNGSTTGDLTRGFRVDAEGNVLVPKGTKVDAQGNLIGPDGKPLTNIYGGKLTVPPGSRVNPDGTLTDPQGKHITESSNNLRTRTPRTVEELLNGQRRPSTTSGDLFGGSKSTTDAVRKLVDSNGNAIREPVSMVSGLSNRARAALGLPPVPTVTTAVNSGVPTQSLGALGRTVQTTGTGGTPFMPPMGMGGGAPGGGSGADRQRNVWLSEDEEVWGTESGTGTGVIGR
ncbi:hypothetical protein ACF07T_34430 [Streptomyces sp. NPDC015184]|uniref:hypothetical protein n=1 Tax=Streptomyces sp. NPDC015184 TaxID=3364946 RepID=UPI0036F9451B